MSTAERVRDGVTDAVAPPRAAPLIPTKLGVPLLAPAYRERPRLDAHLDRALVDATRLTLISAPPGYGKSVAVSGWLAARAVPHTWLSLDPGDNDPARFQRYLIAALTAVRPELADESARIAGPDANAGLDFVGAALIDAMAASDDPFVLVLDDYHVITAKPVHDLVELLVAHGQPFAHLVVLTREDPPFPLARLRAHDRLVELRSDELRYTGEEARRHFAEIAGLDLQPRMSRASLIARRAGSPASSSPRSRSRADPTRMP
jgi:LuxR family maltose regulon positive regulatory protein